MRYRLAENILFIKLDDGEDFLGGLCEIMEASGADSGIILSCVGMLRDTVLAYFRRDYLERALPSPMEIVSIEGNIARDDDDGRLQPHVHATLADESLNVHGGHLRRATVHNTAEIAMMIPIGVKLVRKKIDSRIELLFE